VFDIRHGEAAPDHGRSAGEVRDLEVPGRRSSAAAEEDVAKPSQALKPVTGI
jgi:hypothetical protein